MAPSVLSFLRILTWTLLLHYAQTALCKEITILWNIDYVLGTKTTICPGDTVKWDWNVPLYPHDLRFSDAKIPGSDMLTGPATYYYTFKETGSFDFQCTLHPYNMAGTIIVQDGANCPKLTAGGSAGGPAPPAKELAIPKTLTPPASPPPSSPPPKRYMGTRRSPPPPLSPPPHIPHNTPPKRYPRPPSPSPPQKRPPRGYPSPPPHKTAAPRAVPYPRPTKPYHMPSPSPKKTYSHPPTPTAPYMVHHKNKKPQKLKRRKPCTCKCKWKCQVGTRIKKVRKEMVPKMHKCTKYCKCKRACFHKKGRPYTVTKGH